MMKNRYNNRSLQNIRSLQELNYQRRILASRMEQQEVMIAFKVDKLKKEWSPRNLLHKSIENIAVRKPFTTAFLRAFNWARRAILLKKIK